MENSPGPWAVTNFPKALQDRASALRAPRAGVDWMPSNRGARVPMARALRAPRARIRRRPARPEDAPRAIAPPRAAQAGLWPCRGGDGVWRQRCGRPVGSISELTAAPFPFSLGLLPKSQVGKVAPLPSGVPSYIARTQAGVPGILAI